MAIVFSGFLASRRPRLRRISWITRKNDGRLLAERSLFTPSAKAGMRKYFPKSAKLAILWEIRILLLSEMGYFYVATAPVYDLWGSECWEFSDTRELKWRISCANLGLVVTLARRGDRLVRSRPTTPEDGCVFLFANPEFGDVKMPGTYAAYGYIFVTTGRSRPRMIRKIAKFSHFYSHF